MPLWTSLRTKPETYQSLLVTTVPQPGYLSTKISQTDTFEMVDNPTTGMSQFKLQGRAYENGCSDEEPDEKEATKGIQIQEVNKFMSVGVLSTDLH